MIFKINTPIHTLFAAKILAEKIRSFGFECDITNHIDYLDEESIYIIYNASRLERMPIKYIVYQTEVADSHWFNDKYFGIIKGALAVWEYSKNNIIAYNDYNNNISIVTPGIKYLDFNNESKRVNDIVFYGWVNGGNRERIVKSVKGLTIISSVYADRLWEVLKNTKVVLNVHFYKNAPFEVFRINESLSHGCFIISENSNDIDEKYHNMIHIYKEKEVNTFFFKRKVNNINKLVSELKNKKFDIDLTKLDNTEEVKIALRNLNEHNDSYRNKT